MSSIKSIFSVVLLSISASTSHGYDNNYQNDYHRFKALQAAKKPTSVEVIERSERFISACSTVAEARDLPGKKQNPTAVIYRMNQECMKGSIDCSCSASTRNQVCVFECTVSL